MISKKAMRAIVMAACVPVLVLMNAGAAEHSAPSAGAKGMPGALGTIEYKPTDW